MVSLQEDFLNEFHDSLTAVLEEIRDFVQGPEADLRSLPEAFKSLSKAQRVPQNTSMTSLVEELERFSQTNKPLSVGEHRALTDKMAAVRIHLVAVAFGALQHVDSTGGRLDVSRIVESPAETIDELPLFKFQGNIYCSTVAGNKIVLLPRINSSAEADEAITGLAELYDQSPLSANWVVDFSHVRNLPLSLLADIIAYRAHLDRVGKKLCVCWLRPELIPESSRAKIAELLDLIVIGGHWFSKGYQD